MKKALALVAVAGLAGIASAQTATVTVTTNGANNAIVTPGATVNIAAIATWTPNNQFAGIQGGIIVEGNGGAGSNFTSDYAAGALVNLGTFTGGSRTGMDIAQTPAFFTGGFMVPPSANWSGLNVGSYTLDTTGMAAGTYAVGFVAPGTAPNVRLFTSTGNPNFTEAQTTFVGATLTIVPAPASLALVGLGGLVAGRRRR